MKDFALYVIDLVNLPAVEYADVRVVSRREEHLRVRNNLAEAWSDEETMGFGVRVLAGGYWGFASANDLSRREAERVAAEALALARSAATVGGERARLAEVTVYVDEWQGPCEEDPFALSPEEKLSFLLEAMADLSGPGVTFAQGRLGALRQEKIFASTEGALIRQIHSEAGGGISAMAVREGDVQVRSYPSAHSGSWGQGGFEKLRALDLGAHAARLAEEAVALLDAPHCPAGVTTVILDGEQMALQVHESVGHPLELDRILGTEASYAGSSFVQPEDRGKFQYGSSVVTIVADATSPGGLGSFGYDDEGVAARREPLLSNGLLTGFQSSRETAAHLGLTPSGGMRASGWNRTPLIRMTNVNLAAGEWDLDELIADTEEGFLLSTNKSWSIDDRRLNFHFGTEIGWEIKRGRRGRMLRDCTYSGTTPLFWRSCDAVCGPRHWQLFGILNCGKGEPGQEAHVGHGVAPARFRGVRVEPAR